MLLHAMLDLPGARDVVGGEGRATGVTVKRDDIQAFRLPGRRCSGHPDYGVTASEVASFGLTAEAAVAAAKARPYRVGGRAP